MPRELKPEQITHLILHCSDSAWGDEKIISDWHRQRGFDFASGTYTGYHYVILNGAHTYAQMKDQKRIHDDDGTIQTARAECWWGCHALGFNERSLGICLIGVDKFTPRQFDALTRLCLSLMSKYKVPVEHILGHCETPLAGGKTCPNFPVSELRAKLAANPQEKE